MAIIFPDSNPTATSNDKDVHVKVVQLLPTDFEPGGKVSLKAVLPADSTIIEISSWKETQWSGGGITAATLSIGTNSSATFFVDTADVFTPVAGTQGHLTPVQNIMQHYGLPLGSDISLYFTGTAGTGAPTDGEMYIKIVYVR